MHTFPEKHYGWRRRASDQVEKRRLFVRGVLFALLLVLVTCTGCATRSHRVCETPDPVRVQCAHRNGAVVCWCVVKPPEPIIKEKRIEA